MRRKNLHRNQFFIDDIKEMKDYEWADREKINNVIHDIFYLAIFFIITGLISIFLWLIPMSIILKILDHLLLKHSLMRYIKYHPNDWEIPYLVYYHNREVNSERKKISQEELHELLHGK